ncbi:isochorismatase family cysteine hydrolase [Brevibacillus nitrificans]|uniref:isochorismatase family cysteine hydrolase n=1 Tax=Brevibacillus nitrificans TaxID=651560 RepID=UPI00262C1D02|nr:isochorismatase family cysteine hydrolase [Brevibacillus nitrificans]MED1792087.1 cysteine hydrolase [Brevibacillus nitrificans]
MTKTYDKDSTGLLLVDPYNDFLSMEGKDYPRHNEILEYVNLLEHQKANVDRVRKVGIRVFYVPHHRSELDDFDTWLYPNPNQVRAKKTQIFAKGTWGGEFHPDFQPQKGDVIIKEHWSSSGFASTDLDHQLKSKLPHASARSWVTMLLWLKMLQRLIVKRLCTRRMKLMGLRLLTLLYQRKNFLLNWMSYLFSSAAFP